MYRTNYNTVPQYRPRNVKGSRITLIIVSIIFASLTGVGIYFLFKPKAGKKCILKEEDDNYDANASEYKYKKFTVDNKTKTQCMVSSCQDGYEVSGMPSMCAAVEKEV